MQTSHNVSQIKAVDNPQAESRPLLVRTTTDLQTKLTEVIIPAGTLGRILDMHNGSSYVVAFNLTTVFIIPVNSPLIKIVRV